MTLPSAWPGLVHVHAGIHDLAQGHRSDTANRVVVGDRQLLTQLVESRAAGRFTLRDVRAATGDLAVDDAPDPKLVAAAFMDCELESLKATATAVAESNSAASSIHDRLVDAVGAERATDLAALTRQLQQLHREHAFEHGTKLPF